jgi:PadR family transcriptional regulator, regulatory protein PadR
MDQPPSTSRQSTSHPTHRVVLPTLNASRSAGSLLPMPGTEASTRHISAVICIGGRSIVAVMATAMHEPTFLILASLAAGRKHGYALIADAETMSGGRVTLRVATLYTALDRLTKEGLVSKAGDEIVDGRLRRYYELTDEGAAALQHEVDRMQELAAGATARLRHRLTFGLAYRVTGATWA